MSERLDAKALERILEAALMAAGEPLTVRRLAAIFKLGELDPEQGGKDIRLALERLGQQVSGGGYELKQVASGYRFQVSPELGEWVSRLWDEKPPRYSRALLETLALVVYKQPVTRAEIEHIRGVSVSQNIMRTLLERGWIRVVGQRETPGRPNLYGTTRAFLDYFNLRTLDELPSLAEVKKIVEPLLDVLDQDEKIPEKSATAPAAVSGDSVQTLEAPLGEPDRAGERAGETSLANVVPLPVPRH